MELRHLRYFIAAAEAENVSRAALKLHVSQPALSRQIHDLEDELGFPLLERTAKSVHLTDAGRIFLDEARAVVLRAQQAVENARAVATGARGELHVGYAPSLTVQILPQTLRLFQAELPNVRVVLHDLSTEEMIAQLRDATLQVAFLVRPARGTLRGLRFEELVRYRIFLALAPGHPFARLRNVTAAQVAKEPLVAYSRKEYPEYHDTLRKLFAPTKTRPRIAEEHDSVTSLIAAVESGRGVAFVPESMACFAGPRLKLMPLAPSPEPLIVGLAWSKNGFTPAAQKFLVSAKAAAAKDSPPGNHRRWSAVN